MSVVSLLLLFFLVRPSADFASRLILSSFSSSVWTITAYLRRPSRLRVGRHQSEVSPDPRLITKSVLDVGFTVRTLAFGIYASVAIVFAIVSLVSTSAAPAFYQATAGIVAFVLFGAQRDILQFVRILPSHPHQNLQESPTEHVNVFDKQTQAILDGSEEKDGSADEGDVEKGIEPSTDRKDEEKSAAEEVKVGQATLSSHHP
ncbi:hypothetical protein BDY24DRAFT_240235 [Mrakia frigida]|uniref:uncharacterized protein n=1 Tax=Mrakia frigida TaxID=29902 RepID=UPI003FCBF869